MKKIIITSLFLIIISFIILNYNNFFNYYYNSTGNYTKASNLEGKYNLATKEYIEKKYDNSVVSFSGVLENKRKDLEDNKELLFRAFHNLGNVFYKKGEVLNLKKSIDFYSKALEIKTDAPGKKCPWGEKTIKNLEFVKEKLRELEAKQEKEKGKENKNNDSESSSEGQNGEKKEGKEKDENKSGEKKGDSKAGKESEKVDKKNNNSEKKSEGENGKEKKEGEEEGVKQDENAKEKGLSEKTRKALEKQLEQLKKQQSQIGEYYNKNYKKSQRQDIFEQFFNQTGNFDNNLLDEVEKDW